MESLVRLIERAAAENLHAYVRAMRSADRQSGAEAIACAGGVAAFTGEDSPLTTVKGVGPEISDADIEAATVFFGLCGSRRITFEAAPWITAESVERLTRHGFSVSGTEDVAASRLPSKGSLVPRHSIVEMDPCRWAELVIQAWQVPKTVFWRRLAKAASLLAGATNLGVQAEDQSYIAFGQLAAAPGVAIFGNDATLPHARGRGAQTSLIQHRLRQSGEVGLSWAVAEVEPDSTSERNYQRCGFRVVYTRTYYSKDITKMFD